MRVSVGSRTDVGRVRQGNEDALLVRDPLFGVADGMGGHLAGDVASSTAVEVIEQRATGEDGLNERALERFIKEANRTIWQKAQQQAQLHGMGTTCTLLVIDGATARLAHVGDSRAYLLRAGHLDQLTEDHTLVARMVREGRLDADEAQHHPQRSIITRALGVEHDVDVDLRNIDLEVGDRILLCSDGLSSMLEEDEILRILHDDADPQAVADRLVDAANDAGGEDNITVIVLDLAEGGSDAGARAAARSAPPPDPETEVGLAPVVTSREDDEDEVIDSGDPRPARRGKALLIGFIALLLLLLLTFGAARYALANSWFVGANERGLVTIYQGIPEEVLGVNLKEPHEASGISMHDLPPYLRVTVEQGIKAESLTAARRTVANLEARSRESMEAGAGDTDRDE